MASQSYHSKPFSCSSVDIKCYTEQQHLYYGMLVEVFQKVEFTFLNGLPARVFQGLVTFSDHLSGCTDFNLKVTPYTHHLFRFGHLIKAGAYLIALK